MKKKDILIIAMSLAVPLFAYLDWIMLGYNTFFQYLVLCTVEMFCIILGYMFGKEESK